MWLDTPREAGLGVVTYRQNQGHEDIGECGTEHEHIEPYPYVEN